MNFAKVTIFTIAVMLGLIGIQGITRERPLLIALGAGGATVTLAIAFKG
ncbi:MAG: hypothetical protein QNJ47_27785 [Nostocaceae cyanobacterium]|nr:hypothetical protein [Nostocaceae cyanobacterium]